MDRTETQRAQAPQDDLWALVSTFEENSKALIEALRLFEISQAEYERAMKALRSFATTTSASTQPFAHDEPDALVE